MIVHLHARSQCEVDHTCLLLSGDKRVVLLRTNFFSRMRTNRAAPDLSALAVAAPEGSGEFADARPRMVRGAHGVLRAESRLCCCAARDCSAGFAG